MPNAQAKLDGGGKIVATQVERRCPREAGADADLALIRNHRARQLVELVDRLWWREGEIETAR